MQAHTSHRDDHLVKPGASRIRLIKHHGVGQELITDGVVDLEKVLWWLWLPAMSRS